MAGAAARRPGPPPRQRGRAVVRVQALGVRRRRRDRAAARRAAPPQPLPVMAWARAYGLIRDPGSDPHAVSLIGPGPGFDPGYAMTTSLDDPVIIATLTTAGGEPAGPLLTDGCHRLYKAAVTGRAPAGIRAHRRRDPVHPAPGHPRTRPRRWACERRPGDDHRHDLAQHGSRRPRPAHRDAGRLPAWRPVVRVFAYQADPAGRTPEEIAEEAFASATATPATRRRAPGPPLLPARAAVAVFPRKVTVLRLVVVRAAGNFIMRFPGPPRPGAADPSWPSCEQGGCPAKSSALGLLPGLLPRGLDTSWQRA